MAAQRIVLALATLAALALAFLIPRLLEQGDTAHVAPVQLHRPSPAPVKDRPHRRRRPRERPRPQATATPTATARPAPPVAPPPVDAGEPESDGEREGEGEED